MTESNEKQECSEKFRAWDAFKNTCLTVCKEPTNKYTFDEEKQACHVKTTAEFIEAAEEEVAKTTVQKQCGKHQYFSEKQQTCRMLNRVQCKLLGRLFFRNVEEHKSFCTVKCKDNTMMVQGKYGQCKTV